MGSARINIFKILINPAWNSSLKVHSYEGDIAILSLEKEVKLNNFIQPICIEASNKIIQTQGVLVGYGKDVSKRPMKIQSHVMIPMVRYDSCLKNPNFIERGSIGMICAGAKGKALCYGK